MDKSSTPIVAVLNRKGGSGKSTLATHIAGYLATRGSPVMLGDADRQQTSVSWLRRREAASATLAPILTWVVDSRNSLRKPAGVSHIVLDTPAAMQGLELQRVLNYADAVLVPLSDSVFDQEAAAASIAEIRAHPRVAAGAVRFCAVGMRIDARTRGAESLHAWARAMDVPLVATLRLTQNYVRCAERGLTIFDFPRDRSQTDRAQWAPLLEWLGPVFDRQEAQPSNSSRPAASIHVMPIRETEMAESVSTVAERPAFEVMIRRPVDLYQPRALKPLTMPTYGSVTSPRQDAGASSGWTRLTSWFKTA